MRQTIKARHELRLYELKKAVNEFLEFAENLTLLQAVNEKAQEIAQAVDVLQQLLQQGLADNKRLMLPRLRLCLTRLSMPMRLASWNLICCRRRKVLKMPR